MIARSLLIQMEDSDDERLSFWIQSIHLEKNSIEH